MLLSSLLSNILAGLKTRVSQWWEGIPFLTSAIVILCGIIYLGCLLTGYDSFAEICFFCVYRILIATIFHGSLLHVLFNMLTLVPLGTDLERIMGSVCLLYVIILLATTNVVFHLCIALVVPRNPYADLMNECAIANRFLRNLILHDRYRDNVFGLFNVPAKWYPWILLVVFQLLMTNVSLLGHLCGIYIHSCEGNIDIHLFSGLIPGNFWRNISSWMPQRETASSQSTQDGRFPGTGRTLGAVINQSPSGAVNTDSSLQARLLDNSIPDRLSETTATGTGQLSNTRYLN
ncbi:hypothetical protein MKX03_005451, partial [Papaver bracteatum]